MSVGKPVADLIGGIAGRGAPPFAHQFSPRVLSLTPLGMELSSPKQDAPPSITRRIETPKATFRCGRMIAESSARRDSNRRFPQVFAFECPLPGTKRRLPRCGWMPEIGASTDVRER